MLIYSRGLVVAEKLQVLASWRAHSIVKKVQLRIPAESANPALI